MSNVQVPAPYWTTEGGSLDVLDVMKARELVPSATILGNVMAPQHMSMEEVLASLHHYAIEVYDTSLEDHSHNLF